MLIAEIAVHRIVSSHPLTIRVRALNASIAWFAIFGQGVVVVWIIVIIINHSPTSFTLVATIVRFFFNAHSLAAEVFRNVRPSE
jgi:hypothetical protein